MKAEVEACIIIKYRCYSVVPWSIPIAFTTLEIKEELYDRNGPMIQIIVALSVLAMVLLDYFFSFRNHHSNETFCWPCNTLCGQTKYGSVEEKGYLVGILPCKLLFERRPMIRCPPLVARPWWQATYASHSLHISSVVLQKRVVLLTRALGRKSRSMSFYTLAVVTFWQEVSSTSFAVFGVWQWCKLFASVIVCSQTALIALVFEANATLYICFSVSVCILN